MGFYVEKECGRIKWSRGEYTRPRRAVDPQQAAALATWREPCAYTVSIRLGMLEENPGSSLPLRGGWSLKFSHETP